MTIQELRHQAETHLANVTDQVGQGARSLWLAGIGLAGAAVEESTDLFDRLVTTGKGRELVLRPFAAVGEATEKVQVVVRDFGERTGSAIEKAATRMLGALGVPTRDEVKSLIDRVERLSAHLTTKRQRA